MGFRIRAMALVSAALLGACGGGGGGGTSAPVAATPQAVAITETNAKPVGANAMDSAQSTAASGSTSLLTGVQVDAQGPVAQPVLLAVAEMARVAAGSAGAAAAALPVGVAISQTVNCPLGGSMTVSGNVSGGTALVAGDSITISASNCQESVGGVTTVLSGGMSMTMQSGSIGSSPSFQAVLAVTMSNLSVQTGGLTIVASGDVRLEWNASSSTVQTLKATGTSMSSRQTAAGVTRTSTLKNYTQILSINGSTLSSDLSATVESDSTRLGAGGGIFTISTPTPVVWNSVTGVASAGVVKVVGAANSQLLVTIGSNGAVTLQVDANGDGTFEKTVTSTVSELKTLL